MRIKVQKWIVFAPGKESEEPTGQEVSYMGLTASSDRVAKTFHAPASNQSCVTKELWRCNYWNNHNSYGWNKCKAIPVTGPGGPYCCETLRRSHFLDSRLTNGGEVSLTSRSPFTSRKISWYSFLSESESTPGQ
jgi:hypothetical protein